MKKILLSLFSLSAFIVSAQVEIEPFAPSVPGTYIGGFDVTPLNSISGSTLWTTEGTGTGPYAFVGDDGATLFNYTGSVGNYCAAGFDVGQTLILVSPEMDFGANTANPTLTFRWGQSQLFAGSTAGAYCVQNFEVLYKEGSGGAWNVLTTITALDPGYTWHDETVDLSAVTDFSALYIGFRVNSTTPGSYYGFGLNYGQTVLDEVVVTGEVACSASTSSPTVTVCDTYTVPSGDETYTMSGTVMDTIPSMSGCDSIMTISLTIETVDSSVTESSGTISAVASGGGVTYQWIDCSDNSAIAGETAQNYTPTQNGDYAVVVTNGSCTDTSECRTIEGIGYDENHLIAFKMYPNPAHHYVTLQFSDFASISLVQIISVDGKVLLEMNAVTGNLVELNLAGFEVGIYNVKIVDDQTNFKIQRLVLH